jgi:murein DD-endopeptidase MepM/ murein hydrolase activator NlpD
MTVDEDTVKRLVKYFQRDNDLAQDGIVGPITRAALDRVMPDTDAFTEELKNRLFVAIFLSGTSKWGLPLVTSGFKTRNPSRPNHEGCDFFFRYNANMGPAVVKDGEAAGSTGKPKWFIPKGTKALCAMSGIVKSVTLLKTGIAIWVEHVVADRKVFTGYFHLTSAEVRPGQAIDQNYFLGDVGDNPVDNDARHLHFQLSFDRPGNNVDPQLYIDKDHSV